MSDTDPRSVVGLTRSVVRIVDVFTHRNTVRSAQGRHSDRVPTVLLDRCTIHNAESRIGHDQRVCHSISLPTVLLIPLYVYWRLTHGSLATGLWFALCTRHYTLLNVY